MSTDKKVKVYKNPARNRPEPHKQYVPQYQLMGVEPDEYKSPLTPGYKPEVAAPSTDNPRAPRAVVRQPYAEAVPSPIGRGRGLLPNVGNNMEQTWSGVDGVIDDLTVEPDQTMVDNNEYVSAAALGLPEETEEEILPQLDEVANPPRKFFTSQPPAPAQPEEKTFLTKNELENALSEEYLSTVIKQLEEEDYLLLVSGQAICSGPEEYVQEQTRLLIFGEHELYGGNPVSVDDIVVIKRAKIKVGVFLE